VWAETWGQVVIRAETWGQVVILHFRGGAWFRAFPLSGRARITSDFWVGHDGVVPIGKDAVRQEWQTLHLRRGRFDAFRVVGLHDRSSDAEAGLTLGGAKEVQHFLQRIQRLACPVLGDLAEETVRDRVPLGCTGRVVADCDLDRMRQAEFGEQTVLPCSTARAVAASSVGEDEQLVGLGVVVASIGLPPAGDAVGCEGGRIMGYTDEDVATVGDRIEDSVRRSDVDGVATEVVIIDRGWGLGPDGPRILEAADEFLLLCVDGDDGEPSIREGTLHLLDVAELFVALISNAIRSAGELLVIHAKSVVEVVQETGHGSWADLNVELFQFSTEFDRGFSGPFQARDRIAGCGRHHQSLDLGDDFRSFFPPTCGHHPSPGFARPPHLAPATLAGPEPQCWS